MVPSVYKGVSPCARKVGKVLRLEYEKMKPLEGRKRRWGDR